MNRHSLLMTSLVVSNALTVDIHEYQCTSLAFIVYLVTSTSGRDVCVSVYGEEGCCAEQVWLQEGV